RDYPEPSVLRQIFNAAGAEPQSSERIRKKVKMDEEPFEKALEKLWIHHGALVDADGNVSRGADSWEIPYLAQRDHKLAQLDQMMRCAEAHGCRMLHLVRHFGDQEDSGEACGICDVCDPVSCLVRRFRLPAPDEAQALAEVLRSLRRRDGQSTGQLFRDLTGDGLPGDFDRKAFERLLGGLIRAGLVRLREDEFEKDGKVIRFQRAGLTPDGLRTPDDPAALAAFIQLAVEAPASQPKPRERKKKSSAASPLKALKDRFTRKRKEVQDVLPGAEEFVDEPLPALISALKTWRRTEANRKRIPAFRILTDRTLHELASVRPRDEEELLAIRGIGPVVARKYGREILDILEKGE
ncbi:MAG TPA: HRDC domain-containing protein, partial [Thermoanaerobaculia bacterium]|nr:HRDC domain-containing protein [Thermoanaerobaculia bacterium]